MFKSLKKLFKNEEGQALVLLALGLVVLLGFTAIAVDYGYLAWQRRNLQNAADAAALAAAWELPDNEVVTIATKYANDHVTDSFLSAVKTNNDRAVTVKVNNTFNSFFGKILGYDNYNRSAEATAEKYLVASLDLLPLADIDTYKDPNIKDNKRTIENDPFHFEMLAKNLDQYYDYMKGRIGTEISFREADGNISGNLGLLDLDAYSSGNNIKDVIKLRLNKKVYNTSTHTGINIETEPGKVNSIETSKNDLSKRLAEDGGRAYVIAVLPKTVEEWKGKSQAKWGEYLLLYVEGMSVNIEDDNAPIKGIIKGVFNIHAGEYPDMMDSVEGDERVRLIN